MTLRGRPARSGDGRTPAFVEKAAAEDKEQIHCGIPASLHCRLRVLAAEERTTITRLEVEAVESHLEGRG